MIKKDTIDVEDFVLHTNTSKLRNQNYMEFFIGDFENSVHYWNPGSLYLHHGVYKYFHNSIKKVRSSYNDYNVNRFEGPELLELRDIVQKFDGKKSENAEDHSVKLKGIQGDLVKLIENAIRDKKPLWILGL